MTRVAGSNCPAKDSYSPLGSRLTTSRAVPCLDHSADRHHVRRISHVDLFALGDLQDAVEGLGDFCVEPFEDLFLGPVVVHIVLDAFEVGDRYTAGVAQEVGDDKNIVLLENFIGFRGGGAISALSHACAPGC
jgi:hypothetical protein